MIKATFATALFTAGSAFACDDRVGIATTPQDLAAPKVVLVLSPPPLSQPFSAQIKLCNKGSATKLEVDAIMPAHQHGMNYVPEITDLGDGVYQIDRLVFHMPGEWEFQISVTQSGEVSHYTHTVIVR